MNALKNPKAIAVATTVLFVASLVWLMNVKRVNTSLEEGMENERLKSETLLSEKLLLEKDIAQFRQKLSELGGKNTELEGIIQQTRARLDAQQAELAKARQQNASLAQIKKQREELGAMQRELQQKLDELQYAYTKLQQENTELTSSVALLETRNKKLSEALENAMLASLDQSKVEALKGKSEKLTVRAKKTRKLMATFEVPAELNNLSFRLKDGNGNTLKEDAGTIASRIVPNDVAYASNDATAAANRSKKVEMAYLPKEKLKPGVYTVEILNDNLYVGSLNVRLR